MKIALPVVIAILAAASPAAAGNPQSTGLTHTLAHAQRAATSLVVRHNDAACLQSAAENLSAIPGLRDVTVGAGALRATFVSSAHAGQAEAQVRTSVATTCPAAAPAATPAS